VDVDIDLRRVDFHEQAADRVTAFHQRGVIAFEQGEIEAAILHRPAIDEKCWSSRVPRETPGAPMNPQTENRERGGTAAFRFPLPPPGGKSMEKSTGKSFSPPPVRARSARPGPRFYPPVFDSGQLPDRPSVLDEFKGHAGHASAASVR
jgi:hypothetical protein